MEAERRNRDFNCQEPFEGTKTEETAPGLHGQIDSSLLEVTIADVRLRQGRIQYCLLDDAG